MIDRLPRPMHELMAAIFRYTPINCCALLIGAAFSLWTVGPAHGADLKPPSSMIGKIEPARIVPRVYERLSPETASVVLNLSKQRAYLMLGDEVALETPISSGKRSHPTPTGTYTISEKVIDKRSNIYGNFVDSSGRIVKGGVSTKIDSAPAGTRFLGAPMKYWMRLTDYGIGMHVGNLPGYPASHGCVRLPEELAERIYAKTKVGTPVKVVR